MPPQSNKTVATLWLPALLKVDDGKIDFDTMEALFFSYRNFATDPDAILFKLDYGRAYHTTSSISSAYVLKQLIDDGYIRQMAGAEDRPPTQVLPKA